VAQLSGVSSDLLRFRYAAQLPLSEERELCLLHAFINMRERGFSK
jgi:hypothetical protein